MWGLGIGIKVQVASPSLPPGLVPMHTVLNPFSSNYQYRRGTEVVVADSWAKKVSFSGTRL